jgi:hypothetical protein
MSLRCLQHFAFDLQSKGLCAVLIDAIGWSPLSAMHAWQYRTLQLFASLSRCHKLATAHANEVELSVLIDNFADL